MDLSIALGDFDILVTLWPKNRSVHGEVQGRRLRMPAAAHAASGPFRPAQAPPLLALVWSLSECATPQTKHREVEHSLRTGKENFFSSIPLLPLFQNINVFWLFTEIQFTIQWTNQDKEMSILLHRIFLKKSVRETFQASWRATQPSSSLLFKPLNRFTAKKIVEGFKQKINMHSYQVSPENSLGELSLRPCDLLEPVNKWDNTHTYKSRAQWASCLILQQSFLGIRASTFFFKKGLIKNMH